MEVQPLIVVRDVEASSRWYREVLGLVGTHGGPGCERLAARARAAGAAVMRGPLVNPRAHHRELSLRDPDGYVVVVAGHMETAAAGG